MRAHLPLVLALLPGVALAQIKVSNDNPVRTVHDLMISALGDPAVQVALHVTPTQLSLRDFRLSRQAIHFGLDLMRATVRHNEDEGTAAFGTQFGLCSANALFPYLAPNQVAKLRRLAISHNPEAALGTEEVAFALRLSPAQRARIEAIRLANATRLSRPDQPAMQALQKAYAKIATLDGKMGDKAFEGEITVETIDTMQKGIDVLVDAFEQSTRIYARQPAVTRPNALTILTSDQRRRLRELSAESVALTKPHVRLARLP